MRVCVGSEECTYIHVKTPIFPCVSNGVNATKFTECFVGPKFTESSVLRRDCARDCVFFRDTK